MKTIERLSVYKRNALFRFVLDFAVAVVVVMERTKSNQQKYGQNVKQIENCFNLRRDILSLYCSLLQYSIGMSL